MSGMVSVVSYGLGTLVALVLMALLVIVFIQDITQKKHTVLRNYPVIGHLRYFLEKQGEYFRQYFFMNDREELPFNRATRGWVYRLAKAEGGVIGFGSTNNTNEPGSILFVNHPYPVLEEDRLPTPPLVIGEGYCKSPFAARSIVNISGMSFGAISEPAVRALSRGAALAGCWMDTGEGGLSPFHLEGNCDVIMQIGTANYGVRDSSGQFSAERARELAKHTQVKAFEIKLSQGAKPGKGGVLPAAKVTEQIAEIRGIPAPFRRRSRSTSVPAGSISRNRMQTEPRAEANSRIHRGFVHDRPVPAKPRSRRRQRPRLSGALRVSSESAGHGPRRGRQRRLRLRLDPLSDSPGAEARRDGRGLRHCRSDFPT